VTLTPVPPTVTAPTAPDSRLPYSLQHEPEPVIVGVAQRVNGGYALMHALHLHGVKDLFGYPGGAILPIYDELNRAAPMLPTPMPAPRARWGSALAPRGLGPPTW
jgi:acetolactate synthase I/II/III large subunit